MGPLALSLGCLVVVGLIDGGQAASDTGQPIEMRKKSFMNAYRSRPASGHVVLGMRKRSVPGLHFPTLDEIRVERRWGPPGALFHRPARPIPQWYRPHGSF